MSAFDEMSHGRRRPRASIRRDRPPKSLVSVIAGRLNDPKTGRFVPENDGARYRQERALARHTAESILRLPVSEVAGWLKPHLSAAQAHCQALCDLLPVYSEELLGLCGDLARARLFATACASEGSREGTDPKLSREWLTESHRWVKEARAISLTLRSLSRDTQPEANDEQADLRRRQAAFQAELARRQALPAAPVTAEGSTSPTDESTSEPSNATQAATSEETN